MRSLYQIQNDFLERLFSEESLQSGEKVSLDTVQNRIYALLSRTYKNTLVSIGENEFRSLSNEFVKIFPPKTPSYLTYGIEFPDFLKPRLLEFPDFIECIARFDWDYASSLREIAPDILPLDSRKLLSFLRNKKQILKFQPSVRLRKYKCPVINLIPDFEINSFDDKKLEKNVKKNAKNNSSATHLLFYRSQNEVCVFSVDQYDYTYLMMLSKGGTCFEALEYTQRLKANYCPLKILRYCTSKSLLCACC
ncbi:MAG: DUF2063 domain-containing protein [Alphaproteobacteria bacterium]|nr:DUF2063 domain-containing protein [Alphaproteobacteria bacterium]